MRRMLILEDNDVSARAFQRYWKSRNFDVTVARTALDAMLAFKTSLVPYDVASLDFDLCDADQEYSGLDVAEFIISLPEEVRPRYVRVHSDNMDAAPQMVRLLVDAGIQAGADTILNPLPVDDR